MSKTKNNKKNSQDFVYNKKSLTNSILGIFSSSPKKTLNYKQLSKLLNIRDDATRKLITTVLYELKEIGSLDEIHTGKFKLKSKGGYITGTVEITSHGYGYIISDDISEDVFVSQVNLHHALHGDTVKVYLHAKRKSAHIEGEVTQILEKGKETFVGTVEISRTFGFLVPDHRHMPYDIFIPLQSLNGAKNGQKAVAKITDWPGKSKNPFGEIIKVLGDSGNNETEMNAILEEFELPYEFPQAVEDAANLITDKISKQEIAARKDFREITTFTIDPYDAKDFDDALSIRELKDGNYEIGVHIADVTHYVKEGGNIDNEGFERATSVYLVDRVVPMLPECLSNGICSLRPNEDKLCYSAVFVIDKDASVHSEWFGRTIINSDRRFTYEEAQDIIESGKGDFSDEMNLLNTIAKKLRQKRFEKGSIAFDRTEVKFRLDDNGKPLGVYQKVSKDSNKLIEEFMLLANLQVARFIGKVDKGKKAKTFVYRIHDQPDTERLNNFSQFIKRFGYDKLNLSSGMAISKSLNKLLKNAVGKNEQNVIETLAIRTMAKAAYSTNNVGHYGLSFDFYSHFTSPIRRYPDMMVHRLLDHYLKKGDSQDKKIIEKKCKHSSQMEQRAANAERASIKYKQVEFMSDKIGETFDGVISGVTEWGIYVELSENYCEGMIPLKELEDDFYVFEEENYCITGRHTKKRYQLGDKLKVEIVRANMQKKQLDFRLADQDPD